MKYWTRDDTKEWITQLEHRIEDIDYYLNRTMEWCEDYGIDNSKVIFMCNFITCVWVSYMRNEPITFIELMEILGVENWEAGEEKIYELDNRWGELDHYDLLEQVVDRFNQELD
jgi:hypothetical protein